MPLIRKRLFPLGRLVATPGALQALDDAGQNPWEFVVRHLAGDWGDLVAEDRRLNDQAVKAGGRILSAYILQTGEMVWVITEADRSVTAILLPTEY
jgi:hypothetical protein